MTLKVFNHLVIFWFLQTLAIGVYAQTIDGPTAVNAGVNASYSLFDDASYSSPNFTVSGGYVVTQTHSGMSHSATVNFQDGGTQYVYFYNGPNLVNYLAVTVTCSTPSTPSTTFTFSSSCDNITITRGSAPPKFTQWYWQTDPNGSVTDYGNSVSFTVTSSGQYYLRSKSSNSNCWSSLLQSLPAIPANPIPTNGLVCGNGQITLSATPGANGNTIRWYDLCSGGTLLGTGPSYLTANLTSTTNYYISSYNTTTGAESRRVMITATVSTIPSGVVSVSGNSRCDTGTVLLSGTPGANANSLKWYTGADGGSAVSTGTSYTTPNLSISTTYYVSSFNTSTGCESTSPRIPVTATINPAPSSPTGNGASRCGTGTVTLTATPGANGNDVKWYSLQTGGTALATGLSFPTPSLSVSTTYYISSYNTSTGCESTSTRTAVVATINTVPSPPSGNSVSRSGKGVVTLNATPGANGSVVKWYSASVGGTSIFTGTSYSTPTLTTSTTYYTRTSNTSNGCESSSFPITAYINNNEPASLDKNFIRVENVLISGVTQEEQVSALPVTQKTTTYKYFDGLGRNLQTVSVQGSPSTSDVIQPYEYDQYGRQLKEYLPYTNSNETNGKFRGDALLSAQSNFYTTPPSAVAATSVAAFKTNTFEQSPLNRITEVTGPRDDSWNASPKKVVSYTKLNVASEVPYWKDFISGIPERNGFYAPNLLVVQETIDEEGKITRVYNNHRGLTVMTRVGNGTDWFDTHYVYSPAGLRMFVIQPEGVARLASEFDNAIAADKQLFLDRWAFQYQYDSEQREIAKRVPGYIEGTNGWFYTVFDKWNRVVLTQDPEQRTRNEYTFTKYDRFNRAIITGLYTTTTALATLRTNATASNTRFETELNNSTGYTLTSTFPTSGISEANLMTVNYYDNYSFVSYTGWDAQTNNFSFINVSGYPQSTELLTALKGQVTGAKVRMIGGDGRWLNSVTHYNKKYQPVQVITESHLGGVVRTTSKFDFAGNLEKEQLFNSYSNLTIQHRYTYDHAGRQLAVYYQVNTQPELIMSLSKYNEIGQLVEKNIHSTDNAASFLQSIDYRYNIKGWLTNINNTSFTQNSSNDDTNDLFGMELQYYLQNPVGVGSTGDVVNQKSLYDGNISAIKWKTDNKQGTPEERIYVFEYDVLSRLTKAHYAKNTSSWSAPSWVGDSGMFDEIIHGYDKNGNIKVTDATGNPLTAITRYGRVENSKGIIDQLKYGYRLNSKHSNRLIDIDDTGNSSIGYVPASASVTEEYMYDRNGNLKFDHNKSISSIIYNYLNLVKEVQFTRSNGTIDKIEYTYDAAGNKLSQLVRINGTQVWKTDYVGGAQYDNSTLSFFNTKEGRMMSNNGTFDYEYFYKDHQGNVRLVYGPLRETLTYRATMENPLGDPSVAQAEQQAFKNIAETRHSNATFNKTPSSNQVVVPDKSARCNGYTGYSPVGPAKMLAVSTGDRVYMETYARYNQITGSNSVITTAALLAAFTSPFSIISTGETAVLYQSFNSNLSGISAGMGSSTTVPRAYLVWLFFDSNYAYVGSGGQAITSSAYNAFEKLSRSFTADRNGYLYIYVANESNISAAASVYFDETYLVHEKNNTALQVLQSSDYYPFGLSYNLYQADRLKETSPGNYTAELRNRYLFQGQELQKDLDLGWYQFKWRMHDPAIGRFGAVDPLSEKYVHNSTYAFSENKLIKHIELEGLESWEVGLSTFFGTTKAITESQNDDPSLSDYFRTGVRMLWNGSQLGSGLNNIITGASREASSKVDFAMNGGEQMQQAHLAGQDPEKVVAQHTQEQSAGRKQAYTGMAQVTLFSTSLQMSLFTAGLTSTTSAFSLSSSNYGVPLFRTSSRAFFSGTGTEARAISEGFTTLGKTRAGINLAKMTEGMPYYPGSQAYNWWARLSSTYAKGIPKESSVNVYLNNPSPTGIWNTVEKPILLERGIQIIYR